MNESTTAPATKTCRDDRHVGERDLPLDAFHKHKASPDGRQGKCKVCMCRYMRERTARLQRIRLGGRRDE